jgi:hypothetical protein
MPVKRRKPKGRNIVITSEMVALYRRAKELWPTRLDHIRGMCPGPIGEHCADCLEQTAKVRELHRLSGLKPWDRSPVSELADDDRPQPWLCAGRSFDDIREIKRQLESAP